MEITAALSSLSAAIGLVKSASDARDEAKINTAMSEVNRRYFELSMAAIELVEKCNALLCTNADIQTQLSELQRKARERENYLLHEVAPGRFAYRFNPTNDTGDAPHYVCQTCQDKDIKSVLHVTNDSMLGTTYQCLNCKDHTFYA
ncbi:hypothetical protein [Pseudomonas sp.]|uniref:hypothetical protein n=1 Tax=Pseudomonas sp. TaxID=306 RepID=UPI003F3A885A